MILLLKKKKKRKSVNCGDLVEFTPEMGYA